MTQPRLKLEIDEPMRVYFPGDTLTGQFSLQGVKGHEVRAVELSVLWHTEGKGDEDMSVHHFERFEPQAGDAQDFSEAHGFQTKLPASPMSYRGLIVKICWCVRVRAFLERGKELSREVPFQLGTVPQPQEIAP
jgi:hypothetical protein